MQVGAPFYTFVVALSRTPELINAHSPILFLQILDSVA